MENGTTLLMERKKNEKIQHPITGTISRYHQRRYRKNIPIDNDCYNSESDKRKFHMIKIAELKSQQKQISKCQDEKENRQITGKS